MQVELKQVQREVGITFLYMTHNPKVTLNISDIIAVMRKGKIVEMIYQGDFLETKICLQQTGREDPIFLG
jgi:ABC-type Fe3+/spermidine/putrescine transport system ATPase subunit